MPGAIGGRRKSMYDEEPCPEKSLGVRLRADSIALICRKSDTMDAIPEFRRDVPRRELTEAGVAVTKKAEGEA